MPNTDESSHELGGLSGHSSQLGSLSLRQIAYSLGYLSLQMSSLKDKADTERIPFLARLGFHKNDIASILDTTPGTVAKQLSVVKAAKRTKKTGKK